MLLKQSQAIFPIKERGGGENSGGNTVIFVCFAFAGSEHDVKKINDLFGHVVKNVDRIERRDLNKDDFLQELSSAAARIRNSPHRYDRLFVVIFGHGDEVGVAVQMLCCFETSHYLTCPPSVRGEKLPLCLTFASKATRWKFSLGLKLRGQMANFSDKPGN